MSMLIFAFFLFSVAFASDDSLNRTNLKCSGRAHHNASLTAYYPVFGTDDKRNHLDERGEKLNTLQDYLDGRNRYVTVAGNLKSGIPYGTKVCIEKMNERFGRWIPFEVRDQVDYGKDDVTPDFSSLEICVRTEEDTYDTYVNGLVTIYV
ncbi:uncharacterized protein LOC105185774 [Harpegnathos saltator]|uniref:Uncharacterized protein n=1 Tax=Harpegnathos saltator TaxID=610380 RepID=E2BRG6_HARSA|nr:uncharacterized protein LOC105185774 [Harpegnathos saltator]EFN81744.1 hypothetical protein EAI_13487 [Harpegnathos saltator]